MVYSKLTWVDVVPSNGLGATSEVNAARLGHIEDGIAAASGVFTNVKDYGAVGNGVADDTTAIQAAIASAASSGGGTVFFPTGTYRITTALTVTASYVTLRGDGNVVIDGSGIPAGVTLYERFAIKASGTLGATVAITADLVAGAATVTTTTAGFAAGDMVLITSDQNYTDGAVGVYGNRGALHRVKSVTNTTTLVLTEPSFFTYAAASSATIRKITPLKGFLIEGLSILGGGVGKVHNGIGVDLAHHPEVRRVSVDGCEDTGIYLSRCWGGNVARNVVRNATSPSALGNTGYGVVIMDASREVMVGPGNEFSNCRHSVAGGGDPVSILISVIGNHSSDAFDGHYDVHEEAWWWTFEDNVAIGGAEGFLIRGQSTKVRRNVVRGTASHGILVKSYDTNTDGLLGPEVTDNDVQNTGGSGIQWEGTASCRVKGGSVAGNRLVRSTGNNLTVWLSDNLAIGANTYDTTVGAVGNEGNGIRLVGSSTTSRCERISIHGGRFRLATNRWIRADFTDGLNIDGVFVETNNLTSFIVSTLDTRIRNVAGPGTPAATQTVATDVAFSLTPMVSPYETFHTGTLTAIRTITLSSTNAYTGARFRVVRTGGGAFNLSVGGLRNLAQNQWCEVVYDGAVWVLVGYGTL